MSDLISHGCRWCDMDFESSVQVWLHAQKMHAAEMFDAVQRQKECQPAQQQQLEKMMRSADSLLDCTEFALEWFFEKFDDPKHFTCDCSEDGGSMEWDTNAYIHTERCSSGRDDSLDALKDQIGQWRQGYRAILAEQREVSGDA